MGELEDINSRSINRRSFIKSSALGIGAITLLGSTTLLTSCSNDDEQSNGTSSFDSQNVNAVRISSDLHKSETQQRLAFSIFNNNREIVAEDSTNITLVAPSGKEQTFKDVELREKGIKDRGIFSLLPILNEEGSWYLNTKHKSKPIQMAFSVAAENVAPAIGDVCPTFETPTNSAPLDAKILCTRFEGECGLHQKSVPQLISNKKPFAILFATPARCSTNYCGPVLELTRDALSTRNIDVIHVEIYPDETSNVVLDVVKQWDLPSEPWMFGVNSSGQITSRLDGAFDQSEIEQLLDSLT